MTAFNKKSNHDIRYLSDSTFSCLEFSYICLFLDKNNRGFRFLHLGPGIRVPDSRIHLSILGRNQGLKNYTDLFRLWTFFRSDLIDVNSFWYELYISRLSTRMYFWNMFFKKIHEDTGNRWWKKYPACLGMDNDMYIVTRYMSLILMALRCNYTYVIFLPHVFMLCRLFFLMALRFCRWFFKCVCLKCS